MKYDFSQQVLRTDAAGMPVEWVNYQDAVRCHYAQQVMYSVGGVLYQVNGGHSAATGKQSMIEVKSIIATYGVSQSSWHHRDNYAPPLSNETLFSRDDYLCLYCGKGFFKKELSRDHVTPISQQGKDVWTNVVTACKRCNNFKAGRTPEQSGMQLLAVPFTPTHAEYVFLRGRKVLEDQMEFLSAHFPRTSPLRDRVKKCIQ